MNRLLDWLKNRSERRLVHWRIQQIATTAVIFKQLGRMDLHTLLNDEVRSLMEANWKHFRPKEKRTYYP